MAEYYPLLARAVASMPNSTPQARSAIYERARKALIGQLRTIDPPVPEEDISRESRALDDAVARLESEIEAATRAMTAAARPTPPQPPAPPQSSASRAEPPRRPDAFPAPPKPIGGGKPGSSAPLPPPLAPEKRVVAPPPPFPARSSAPASPGVASRSPVEAKAPVMDGSAAGRSAPSLRAPGEAPAAPPPRVRAPDKPFPVPKGFPFPALEKKPSESEARNGAAQTADLSFVDTKPLEANAAPAAADAAVVNDQGEVSLVPKEATGATRVSDLGQGLLRKFGRPRAALDQSGAAPSSRDADAPAVANENDDEGAAEAAFDRMSRPRGDGARPLAPQAAPSRAGRLRHVIVGSVVGAVVVTVAITAYVLRDRPEDFAKPRPAATADQPESAGKIVERIGGGTSGNTAPARNGQQAMAPANPPLPVAQRAALLVQAPTSTDPQAVATYVGTAVWRLDTVPAGQGQPNTIAVRADIDIPEAKLKASFVLTKNTDDALPASHLIDIRFMPQPGSVVAGVKQIDAPQMRREDTPQGEAVAGVARAVRDNYFFVALAKSDTYVARNLDLLRARPWIDVPMLLPDNKIAKITFEKGPSGDRAFADAFSAWGK